jgi:hypothetical protein
MEIENYNKEKINKPNSDYWFRAGIITLLELALWIVISIL